MGILICQFCEQIVEHFEAEKVTVLYTTCHKACHHEKAKEEAEKK